MQAPQPRQPRATPGGRPRSRTQNAQRLQRSVGRLSTASLSRMERDTPWVAELSAHERSLIGMIVQAGITAFVEWYRDPTTVTPLRAQVFGAAPQAFAGVITLQQTVELVRLSIDVVEENLVDVVGELDAPQVRDAINSYAREVAFATAEVYARAAEQRGAWDARLEALVVDTVLRGPMSGDEVATALPDLASRASALGWRGTGEVVVVIGSLGDGTALEQIRHRAHERQLDCLCAVQGQQLVVILGGVDPTGAPAHTFADAFADGPIVIGPVVGGLDEASSSAEAARSGIRAIVGWAHAPRPVSADELLPERALDGDNRARAHLVSGVYASLAAAGEVVLETVATYLDTGSSIEGTGRSLYVHPNTVRYRLRRAAELTGLNPVDPRDSFTLRVALALGRLHHDNL